MNSFADEFKDEKKLRGDSHAPIDVMCDHYHKKNEGFLKALYASKGRLLRSLFRIFYFSIFNNRKEKLKYSYRFLGLINSIFAKKSWFRINDREN